MAHVTDSSLDALLALEGVQVQVEHSLNFGVELVDDGGRGAVFAVFPHGSASAEGEGERGEQEQETSQDQEGQDDSGEDVHTGVFVMSSFGYRVVIVVEVALGSTVFVGLRGRGRVRGGSVTGLR